MIRLARSIGPMITLPLFILGISFYPLQRSRPLARDSIRMTHIGFGGKHMNFVCCCYSTGFISNYDVSCSLGFYHCRDLTVIVLI
uniref:Uncharacterized protein n=1 Tax=Utricularia reniformis TaxID=192314 RepID=A0A1Y0B3Z8_9LAMI|nr:hypothetical protein AEK19_MT1951 [Utricularia reniformis]ART32113.1 hypothetical protein AEK19_MT1951 [Utricularia reniformis]